MTATTEATMRPRNLDGHKAAEQFFTTELSKKMGRQVDVAIMWIEFDEIDIPNPSYHKSVSSKIVDEMFKEFDPLVAQFLVANIRENGSTALVDGRHRRAMAQKAGNSGWWFTVTHGLTIDEEARMFRWFQARKNPNTAEKLNGLIIEGNKDAIALRAAVTSCGCSLPFEDDKKRQRIDAVEALIYVFQRGGPEAVKRVLGLCMGCWMGQPTAFSSVLMKGLWIFLSNEEVKGKLDWDIFREVVKKHHPDSVSQRGRLVATQERCPSTYGIASILRLEYNRKVRGVNRLDHDFAHAPRRGLKRPSVQAAGNKSKREAPEVPLHLKDEIEYRQERWSSGQRRGGRPLTEALRSLIVAAVEDGYNYDKIKETYGVSDCTLLEARKEIAARLEKMAKRGSRNGRRRV